MDAARLSVEIFLEKYIKVPYANCITSSPITKNKLKLTKVELMKFSSATKHWITF